jgi:O-antigen/teichoic acid export membrane protein
MLVFFWPRLLLSLFGKEFSFGAPLLLQVLIIGEFVNAAAGPVGMALLMSGRERLLAIIISSIVASKIVMNVVAIRFWHELGAAVVSSINLSLLNAVCLYSCRKITRQNRLA